MKTERWEIHRGDCLAWLKTLPDNSFDSAVTDPPAGIAFMGKVWDENRGGRAQWVAWMASVLREVLRVLKPGAHALVWSLPRTEHWTACAIEDAGFEIRDGVYHLNGQGWPKSLDVSKAIDDLHGAERTTVARAGVKSGTAPDGATYAGGLNVGFQQRELTAPETLEAARWNGWGTGLKPAVERWVLARKPLAGTVAENVLAFGTGAVNIDACRVPVAGASTAGRWPANLLASHSADCAPSACVIDCPVNQLDAQSGHQKSSGRVRANAAPMTKNSHAAPMTKNTYAARPPAPTTGHEDEGGASRFFTTFSPFVYSPKVTTASTRGGAHNTHPTVKSVDLMRWLVRLVTPTGGRVLDPFGGSGTTGVAALLEGCTFAAAEADAAHYLMATRRLKAMK